MPSSSKKQHNFMAAVANNPAFAKKVGIPQSVGEDFTSADKGKKFGTGGTIGQINKQQTRHGAIFGSKKAAPDVNLNKYAGLKKGGNIMAKESKAMEMKHAVEMKKAGVPKKFVKEEMAEAAAMKKGGKVKKMADGGLTAKPKPRPRPIDEPDDGNVKAMKKGGMSKYARGGGIESKGKTRGKFV